MAEKPGRNILYCHSCFWSFLSSGEAVFARCLSSLKDERVEASKQLKGPAVTKYSGDKKEFVEHIRKVSRLEPCIVLRAELCTVQYV